MNCDADIPAASETACSKVRSQFQQATGHDLPCEVSCPCAIPGTIFSQVLSGELPAVACIYTPFEGITDGVVVYYSIPGFAAFSVEINNDIWICGPDGYFLPLTPEQGQYCVRLLEQAANSQGVTCQKP
jgi:hypothetical protein